MTSNQFDLVVVGGGPAGYAAALAGSSSGLSVGLVERDLLGGTCLHRGCIPAKELLETANVHRTVAHAGDFGVIASAPTLDFATTQSRKDAVISRLFAGVNQLLENKEVTVFPGTGRLQPGRTVSVERSDGGEQVLTGESVVLAAGSVPRTIPGFEIDGELVLTSNEVLELQALPSTAAIIGGGAIGCEFASMLSDLGTETTILESMSQLIPGADSDVANVLQRSFKKRGISTITGVAVKGHSPQTTGTIVHLEDGTDIDVEMVIVCVGRRPFADHLGLNKTSVQVNDSGFVVVDELCRTTEEHVYAVGDLIDTPQLAHVGFAEAMLAVRDMLGQNPSPIDYLKVPWAIYCHPEVAFAGMTEQQALDAGHEVVVAQHRYAGNARAMIVNETDGMVKVIADRRADGTAGQILGVHLVGALATEQLSQGYLAVNWEATVDEIAEFIQPHPTLSELFGEAALDLAGRALHS